MYPAAISCLEVPYSHSAQDKKPADRPTSTPEPEDRNQNQNQIHFASGLPVLNIINKNQNVNQRNRKQPRKCTNKSAAQAVTVASLSAGIVPPVNSDDIAGSLVQHHIAFPVDQS